MPSATTDDIHRIGGGSVGNLRLRPQEARLDPPGISVLRADSPGAVEKQMMEAFPQAARLHEATKVIGSTTAEKIESAGFRVIPNPTRKLPNHCRIVHSDGAAGFNKENLRRLAEVFTDTREIGP